jgi:IgGFc binding protein
MTTLHRIPSLRFAFVPALCALLMAGAMMLPARAHAQQARNPIPDTECQCGGPAITTTPTNAGTDFLLCFEENIDGLYSSQYSSGSDLEIYIASLADTATVTITSKAYPALDTVFFLQPNSLLTYDITNASVQGVPMHNLWVVSDEVPDNTVVQVQSTSPIVCYGLNYKDASADAFCALPAQSAGTDYRIISYPNSQSASPNTSSQFAIAAFEDSTAVTITPAVPTLAGHAAGASFEVMLQRGQCIQVQTDNSVPGLDLTGSMVSADHPITVYGSHARTEAPQGYIAVNSGAVSRDILLQTMPPTSTWGQAFVLDPIALESTGTTGPDGDIIRVLALNDSTIVTVNGNRWSTLNHNQFIDSIVTGPTLVMSSGPILVAEIEHSDYYLNIGGDDDGDPSLFIVPPVDQTFNNYTFFLATNTNFNFQGLIIAADTNTQGNIVLDGAPIPPVEFSPVSGSVDGRKFSLCQVVSVTQGVHTISTTNPPDQGFTILAYGLGKVISYGYAAGSLLVPKRSIRIEYPPIANGPVHPNVLNFHNTAYQPAYVDSAVFVPDNFKDQGYGIHTSENVAYDIGRVDIGGSGQIHLVSDIALSYPVIGTEKIYSHLPSYFNIEPGEMHVTVYPESAAGVSPSAALALTVTATPNPFSEYTYINFSVPETGDITMTLYDELGRIVQHIAYGEFSAGPYSVRVERRGLANGVYVCEISSTKLNIHTRIPIVAGE